MSQSRGVGLSDCEGKAGAHVGRRGCWNLPEAGSVQLRTGVWVPDLASPTVTVTHGPCSEDQSVLTLVRTWRTSSGKALALGSRLALNKYEPSLSLPCSILSLNGGENETWREEVAF